MCGGEMDSIFLWHIAVVTKPYGFVSSLRMLYIFLFLKIPDAGRKILHKNLRFLIFKKGGFQPSWLLRKT